MTLRYSVERLSSRRCQLWLVVIANEDEDRSISKGPAVPRMSLSRVIQGLLQVLTEGRGPCSVVF